MTYITILDLSIKKALKSSDFKALRVVEQPEINPN